MQITVNYSVSDDKKVITKYYTDETGKVLGQLNVNGVQTQPKTFTADDLAKMSATLEDAYTKQKAEFDKMTAMLA